MGRLHRALLLTLIFTLIPLQNSSAAVKTGAKCKKAGQVAIAAGKQFTCVKQGKNLVWSKGKIIKQAAPKDSSGKTTPIATPTSKEAERVQLLLTDISSKLKPSKAVVELIVGPGDQNQIVAQTVKSTIDASLQIAEAIGIEFTRPYKTYVGDQDWLMPFMPPNTWCSNPQGGLPSGANAGFCGFDNGVIFVNRTGFLYDGTRPIPRDFTKGEDRDLIIVSFAHEIFHAMQAEFNFRTTGNRGNFNAFWLNEGGANVVGALVKSLVDKVDYREARTGVFTYRSCMQNPEQFKIKDFTANTGNQGVCGPYFAGFFWSEYLIAKSGDIGALLNLAKINRSVLDQLLYDPAFPVKFEIEKLTLALRDVYGIELDSFISEAETYFVNSAKELKAWAISKGIYEQ